ncbi:SCO family protein [Patescibacteria group bacterium]|nr:SCO family protein [Patescibacteria group bacterium]
MNPVAKKIFGYVLILSAFGLIAGLAFPSLSDPKHAGRSEKRMAVDFPFLEKESSNIVLVYFGYVGCGDVCSPALQDLSQIYELSKKQGLMSVPSVWFVNMTPNTDTQSVQRWAEYFNPDFNSYAPNQTELVIMIQTLNAVYTQLGLKAEFCSFLYLLQKKGKGYELVYIYTSVPYHRTLILKDIGVLP